MPSSLLAKNKEAMESLRHAVELTPEIAALMNDLACLIVDSGGNIDEALALAQKANRAAPGGPEIADTLAWTYFKKNQNDSALQILRGLVRKYRARRALNESTSGSAPAN